MRKTMIAVGFVGLLAFSAPASAQGFGQVTFGSTTATPAPASASTAPRGRNVEGVTVTSKKQAETDKDPKEVLCHSEPVIGSLFPKKICASRREIAERRQNDQDQANDFQRSVIIGVQPH